MGLKRPSGPRLRNAQRTPRHTHRFPGVRESPRRPVSLLSVSPLVARTTSTSRRITRAARVRKPSAENRSDGQKLSFPRSSSCVLYPRHTTHIRASAFSFPPAITIAPYHLEHFEFCVFPRSISRVDGATELGTLHLTSGLTSFVSPELL